MNKTIFELYGLGSSIDSRPSRGGGNVWDSGTIDNNFKYDNEFKKTPHPFDADQLHILNGLDKGYDLFVSLPPSRGKTRPILSFVIQTFQRHLLKHLKMSILFVVPRKQLAGQIAQNDFIKEISNFILSDDDINIDKRMIPGFSKTAFFAHIRSSANKEHEAELYAMNIVDELFGGGTTSKTANSIIVVATYDIARLNLIQKFNFSHIIVDEVQELFPHPNETITDGLENRFLSLISILKYANRRTPIVLMTGSINNNTIAYIIKYFKESFNRDFKIVPPYNVNAPLLNRSNLILMPLQTISGYPSKSIPERVRLCKDIIVSNQNNSIMIIFSKQRSGQGIFKLMEELVSQLPPKPLSFFNQNITPATKKRVIEVIRDNKKTFIHENRDIEFLRWFRIEDIILDSNNAKMPTRDENNLLFQSVIRGVAPLIGSMHQIHKKIVQQLFVDKKIQLLLATDALGVGANVNCRFIYIPTVFKFNGKRLERTDESSLTQLVHRAGRGFTDYAYVFSSIEDYDYVSELIFNDPRSAVPELNTYALENLKSLEDSLPKKSFLNLLRGIF